MTHKRFFPRTLTLLGLVLSVLILTMAMLTFVQAMGAAASISIAKEANHTVVHAGDTVNYVITVDNDGDSDLTDVTVDDDLVGCTLTGPSGDNGNLILEPDETWTYACSVTAGSADIVNTATVTAGDGTGGEVSDSAQAAVDVIHPGIEMDKTADPLVVNGGETVNYTVTIENTGDSRITDVTVDDPNCTLSGPYGDDGDLALDQGEIWTYTCSVTADGAVIVNTATFRGYDKAGAPVDGLAQAEVVVIHPEIEIAKTTDTPVVSSSTTVTFTIAVTNTGDVTLTAVTVADGRAPNCNESLGTLEADDSHSYECTANVTDGLINSATVIGTSQPGGDDVTDADAAKVRLDTTQPCPADMLAYWKLDELSSPYDDFYYGHDGECAGTCPVRAPGPFGYGQAFDGSNTGIDVPVVPGDDSFDWGRHDSFSIEFWMKADSANSCDDYNEVIVGRDDASSTLHWWVGIRCGTGGQAIFHLRDNHGSGDQRSVVGTTVLTDGLWHHVVAVGDADADEIRISVDGKEEGSESTDYSDGFESLEMAALNIGWLSVSPFYRFAGIVDEVAVYDRALFSDEIRQHYNEGLAGLWYCHSGPFAPVIVSTPVTDATAGRPYVYAVEAVGTPVPTYTLDTKPNGMTIDSVTGLISWTPMVAHLGSHVVEVRASNSEGDFTQPFTVEVHEGAICPTDMIAYWKLDEVTGTTIYYDFYNGHDGTCAGQCPEWTAGHVDGGQAFDGSSTGIDVPAHNAFDWGPTDSFSTEFWMQTDSASTCAGNQVVVGRNDTPLQWWAGCKDGGVAEFYLRDTNWNKALVTGTTDLTDGLWHHVVAVRDASAGEIRIYVDGTEEGSTPAIYVYGFDSATAALNIGWLNLDLGYHFAGAVDEAALYDRALSDEEIERHYNEGDPGPGYCLDPQIAVGKTASAEWIYLGDVVTYTYTITNPGDDPLSVTPPSDDKCSAMEFVGGDTNTNSLLDLDEIWTYTCSTPLSSDTTNTVVVTGTTSSVGPVGVDATDTAFVEVRGRQMYLPVIKRN